MYRYYDGHGVLIYVGITSRATGRNSEHNKGAEWWPYVTRQEVEHHPSREVAHAREVDLIRQFRPPFNKQHNLGAAEMRRAYLAFVSQPESPESFAQTYQRIRHRLPLRLLSIDGPMHCFVSAPDHAAVSRTLEWKKNWSAAVRCSDGPQPGAIRGIEQFGPYVVVTAEMTCLRGVVRTAALNLKVVSLKKPITTKVCCLLVSTAAPVKAS